MKYNRDISRHLKHEVPFSEIPDLELNRAGVYDKYSSDYTAFNVLGMEVQVSDDQLSKALKCLPERKRNIILLSYFMDMSDAEIGELMNVVRTTIYQQDHTSQSVRKAGWTGWRTPYQDSCVKTFSRFTAYQHG